MPHSGVEKPTGGANGTLSVSAAHQADRSGRGSRGRAKISQDGVKMSIRYLPPGLKEFECTAILGEDWSVGKGRVDWTSFEPGKQARTPGKPSRPAILYLHLTKPDLAPILGESVRNATWEDSSNTYNDPALLFPPFVEKCAFQRIPPPRDRADQRQGTIDTDPDFMAFLEELANPHGSHPEGTDENADTPSGPRLTPLVEYIKAKRANREKESKSSRSGNQSKQDGKSTKSKGADEPKRGKERGDKADKPKEEVKILKKSISEAPRDGSKGASGKAAAVPAASSSQATSAAEATKSRRAGIAAAARLLQRDLGLSPGTAHRRARLDAAKAEPDTKTVASAHTAAPSNPAPSASNGARGPSNTPSQSSTSTAQAPRDQQAKPQTSGRSRGRGSKNADKGKGVENNANGSGPTAANPPILLRKRPEQTPAAQASASSSSAAAPVPTSRRPSGTEPPSKASADKPRQGPASAAPKKEKPVQVTPGATRAFVKHANPSQGATEQLLKQALGAFGTITFVEIDKRKGFAYVDFAEHEALVRAISESPVPVAQATVQVLERKDKKPAQGPAASGAAAGGPSAPGAAEKEKDKEKSGHRRRGRRGGGGGGGGEKGGAGGSNKGASGSTAG